MTELIQFVLIQVSLALFSKIQVLEDVGTNLYSADTINQYIRQNYAD